MKSRSMKSRHSIFALTVSALALSGCVGGTTYGTGVSHEQQTLEGITNMFSVGTSQPQEKIDYAARPDLVMPADKNNLPQPLENAQSTSDAEWPEEPGERLARLRGQAATPDARSGAVPVSELTREKEGIRVTRPGSPQELNPADDRYDWRKKFISEDAADKEVKERKEKLAYSTGPKRKFLTEPPSEYRTPAAEAAAGDLGISDAELERLEKEKKKAEQEAKSGRTVYN